MESPFSKQEIDLLEEALRAQITSYERQLDNNRLPEDILLAKKHELELLVLKVQSLKNY